MGRQGSYLLVILITLSVISVAYLAEVNSQPPKESSPSSIICGFIEDDDRCGLPDYLHECSTGKVYNFPDAPSVSRSSHICVVLVNPTVSGGYTITSYVHSEIIKDCSGCPQISTTTTTGLSPTTPSSSPTPSPTLAESPISTSSSVIPASARASVNIMVTLVGVVFVILVVVTDLIFARTRKEI